MLFLLFCIILKMLNAKAAPFVPLAPLAPFSQAPLVPLSQVPLVPIVCPIENACQVFLKERCENSKLIMELLCCCKDAHESYLKKHTNRTYLIKLFETIGKVLKVFDVKITVPSYLRAENPKLVKELVQRCKYVIVMHDILGVNNPELGCSIRELLETCEKW